MPTSDLVVKNARVVLPGSSDLQDADLAVSGGRFTQIAPDIAAGDGTPVFDAGGRLVFPGVVDAHQHWGIYNPLGEDTRSESRACAQGGVTTGLTYMRTGQYYLNEGGPYERVLPEGPRGRGRQRLRRLRVPPRADDARPHRRDPAAGREVRRHVVQDLHVLRRVRAARRLRPASASSS